MIRLNNRRVDQIRYLKVEKFFTKYAEGSILISLGDTKVLCNASIIDGVPKFMENSNQGWLTAEYGMLPRSTKSRMDREAVKGKQSGRTQEIQRLIGRVLRTSIDLDTIPGYTIKVDCDVIQADGGTRTAAITGASLAIEDLVSYMKKNNMLRISSKPILSQVIAISVGIMNGIAILDMDYEEDSNAETDINIVMTNLGKIIEIQGTAEVTPFSENTFLELFALAKIGIREIIKVTRR
jgi:ribonuclease PH